jgi:hypothetical protein
MIALPQMYQTGTPGMMALISQDDVIWDDSIDYRMISLPQIYLVTTPGLQNQGIDCSRG